MMGASRLSTGRQWPNNITSGDLRYSGASNYSGFSIQPADHGIPTCGAIVEKDGLIEVDVFNYPGQTEAIAKQIVSRWNCHNDLVKAAKRAFVTLKAQGESVRPGNVLGALEAAIRKAEASS